jgi:peptide/nickel transport system permease protein
METMWERWTSLDSKKKSKEIVGYYEQLAQTIGYESVEDLESDIAEDKVPETEYGQSQWRLILKKFLRNRAAIVGGVIIGIYYLVAVFAGFIAPYGLTTRARDNIHMPPQRIRFVHEGSLHRPFVYGMERTLDENYRLTFEADTERVYPIRLLVRGDEYKLFGLFRTDVHLFGLEEGGVLALLGTDRQGRDVFSRIVLGSQVSLSIGLVGVIFSLVLGTVLGIVSGYFGKWVDDVIQRIIELIRSFPSISLWMALSAAVPQDWSVLQTYFAITIILSLIGWTWLARQLRGSVLALRNVDYVLAARLSGASHRWIIFRHLIPATAGHIIVVSTLSMPAMILAETSLSFLGLGLRPPVTSWGVLIQEAQNFQTIAHYPWLFLPAAFMAVAILAFSYLGDGLRDAIDPYTI